MLDALIIQADDKALLRDAKLLLARHIEHAGDDREAVLRRAGVFTPKHHCRPSSSGSNFVASQLELLPVARRLAFSTRLVLLFVF